MKKFFTSWTVYIRIVIATPILLLIALFYTLIFTDIFAGSMSGIAVGAVIAGPIFWSSVLLFVSLVLGAVWKNRTDLKKKYVKCFWVVVLIAVLLLTASQVWSTMLQRNYEVNLAKHQKILADALKVCTVKNVVVISKGGAAINYHDRPSVIIDGWISSSDVIGESDKYEALCSRPLEIINDFELQ